MEALFDRATSFNGDLSMWDVSSVTRMQRTFNQATSLDQIFQSWDVSNVTTMRAMFRLNPSFNDDISNWNVANLTDMGLECLINATSHLIKIYLDWDVSKMFTNMLNTSL